MAILIVQVIVPDDILHDAHGLPVLPQQATLLRIARRSWTGAIAYECVATSASRLKQSVQGHGIKTSEA